MNVTTKIHDQYSIEFKVGFSGNEERIVDDFSANAWIFLPNSLDINPATYGKEQFYRDVKSNVRLITPDFSLSEITQGEALPYQNLCRALEQLPALTDFEFHVKLFAAIFRSSLRETFSQLQQGCSTQQVIQTVDTIRHILSQYRALEERLFQATAPGYAATIFHYADEHMSQLACTQSTKLLRALPSDRDMAAAAKLADFLQEEKAYQTRLGYTHLQIDNEPANRDHIARQGLLRKYIDSSLYLKMDTTEDGTTAQQFSFGMAAGIAMLISMLIALPFQKYLGNYPTLIFIVLVVAYMFKDRIKEMARKRFAHRLKSKYYDIKNTVHFKNEHIGWIKESVDFINDAKTPAHVLALRNRSELESDNTLLQEKTILYRKKVHVDSQKLRNRYEYRFSGINDILRLYFQHFTRKMDDPEIITDTLGDDGQLHTLTTPRVYTLHIVLQFIHDEIVEYRTFRIALTRNGILDITENVNQ